MAPGDVIPPQFDSMIAKVIAWGRDRSEARARLTRALRQTATVINGGTTNKAFLLDLLARPEFVRGEVDTTWLDAMMADGYTPPRRVDVALLAAAFEAYEAHARRQQDRLFTSAERGRPEVGHETRHQVDVRAGGEAYRLRVCRSRPGRYQVELDGRSVEVDVERSGRFELRLSAGGQAFDVLSVAQGPDYLVEVDGAVHRISGGEAGLVRAPAPAMVVAIPVAPGDGVAEGDIVAVVESMKLETALRAPVAGRVAEVFADVNTQVESGAKLLLIEPAADEAAEPGAQGGHEVYGGRADLGALAGRTALTPIRPRPPRTRWRRCVRWCSAMTPTSTRPGGSCSGWPPRVPSCPLTTRRCWQARPRSCRSSRTCPRCGGAAGCRASRKPTTRPPSTTRPPAIRRSTCTPTCGPATSRPRDCPSPSGSSSAGPWPTTAAPTWRRRPIWTPRFTGSSWLTAGRPRTSRSCRTCCSGGLASRNRWPPPTPATATGGSSTSWCRPPSCGIRPSATWPGRCVTAASTPR